MKNVKKCGLFLAAAVLTVFSLVAAAAVISEKYEQWKRDNSGIPDAVSSVSAGGTCRLTVVANSGKIEDGEAFAYQVLEMYRENLFQTIHFSTDIGEMPGILDITVYLKRGDIGKKEPVMKIYYDTEKGMRFLYIR